MEEVDAMVEKAIGSVFAEKKELFLARPVFRGIDELMTELDDNNMLLLITAEVREKDIYDARRAILRAVKVAMENDDSARPDGEE